MRHSVGTGEGGMVFVNVTDSEGGHTVSVQGIKSVDERRAVRSLANSMAARGASATEIFRAFCSIAKANEASAQYYYCGAGVE